MGGYEICLEDVIFQILMSLFTTELKSWMS